MLHTVKCGLTEKKTSLFDIYSPCRALLVELQNVNSELIRSRSTTEEEEEETAAKADASIFAVAEEERAPAVIRALRLLLAAPTDAKAAREGGVAASNSEKASEVPGSGRANRQEGGASGRKGAGRRKGRLTDARGERRSLGLLEEEQKASRVRSKGRPKREKVTAALAEKEGANGSGGGKGGRRPKRARKAGRRRLTGGQEVNKGHVEEELERPNKSNLAQFEDLSRMSGAQRCAMLRQFGLMWLAPFCHVSVRRVVANPSHGEGVVVKTLGSRNEAQTPGVVVAPAVKVAGSKSKLK